MKITTIGIDLAKNVFMVHGVDQRGNRHSNNLGAVSIHALVMSATVKV